MLLEVERGGSRFRTTPCRDADPLPGAVRLLGPVGSLSYALSHRPATVGGALDAYSKGIYAQYHDVQDCYAYQAMTLPQEQLPDLVEEWRQTDRAGWSVLPGTDPRSASYRTGPIFRGLSYDGEGYSINWLPACTTSIFFTSDRQPALETSVTSAHTAAKSAWISACIWLFTMRTASFFPL